MDLIELDNCFVQPHAILVIDKERIWTTVRRPGQTPVDMLDAPNEWVEVIQVILFHQEKRVLMFEDAESRNKRFAEIIEQMRAAKNGE